MFKRLQYCNSPKQLQAATSSYQLSLLKTFIDFIQNWLQLIATKCSFLIHLHWSKLDQKWIFDQFESGSKVGYRSNWVTWSLISKRNRVDQKSVGMHMLHVTHLLHILYWIKSWTPAYWKSQIDPSQNFRP